LSGHLDTGGVHTHRNSDWFKQVRMDSSELDVDRGETGSRIPTGQDLSVIEADWHYGLTAGMLDQFKPDFGSERIGGREF
jgi:hypothetical protein